MQVSRTGRVRVKPLAFWANQRLSRDALAIDQGFSDQLAQQCRGASQHVRPKTLPVKGQPKSADKIHHKPAALQKDAKPVRLRICACFLPAIPRLHVITTEILDPAMHHIRTAFGHYGPCSCVTKQKFTVFRLEEVTKGSNGWLQMQPNPPARNANYLMLERVGAEALARGKLMMLLSRMRSL